jgi:hypothetical protein
MCLNAPHLSDGEAQVALHSQVVSQGTRVGSFHNAGTAMYRLSTSTWRSRALETLRSAADMQRGRAEGRPRAWDLASSGSIKATLKSQDDKKELWRVLLLLIKTVHAGHRKRGSVTRRWYKCAGSLQMKHIARHLHRCQFSDLTFLQQFVREKVFTRLCHLPIQKLWSVPRWQHRVH